MKILSSRDSFPSSQTHAPWYMDVSYDHKTVNWAFCDLLGEGGWWPDMLYYFLLSFRKAWEFLFLPPGIPTLVFSSHNVPGLVHVANRTQLSDGMSLLRWCYRRLWLPSWAFSLLELLEGSPVMSSPVAPMPRDWNLQTTMWASLPQASPETAAPADSWDPEPEAPS